MNDTFNAGHLAVLERVAAGAPLPQLLEDIVRFIERQSNGMVCSILLLDSEERCVRHGAAPSLPPEFVQALDGARIGPNAGSCGAAAYRGERIIVSDISKHPNWDDYRHLALPHGLRACWSTPIFSPESEVLGTFAMYYREVRNPSAQELHWVDVATHLASIAILRCRAEQQLRRSERRAQQIARLYAVSNGINEVIVRVREPESLYDFACQIAVEQGLARLAWVGLCVRPGDRILPVARYGVDAEYVDSVRLSVNDERIKHGPTVRAITTGEPALSNDIEHDPNFYFKDLALRSGLRSYAVFPIKVSERVIGVFALYAERPNYFRTEEVQVLTTLAADISFAVESIVNERERRRMEESARASEALRAFIYSSVEDIIFYLGIEGEGRYRFLSVNSAFLTATGLQDNDVAGKLVSEVIPEPSRTLVLQKYAEAIATGERVSWEEVTSYPSGLKYGQVTVCPVLDGNGRCANLVGTVHDITALRQAEERRLALETQLHQSQRLQSLGTLAGGIAHDFNNILGALSFSVDLALLDTAPDMPLRRNLLDMQKAVRRGNGLVRQILTFGRREPPRREMVDLRVVVDETLQLVRPTLTPNVQAVTSYQADTPIVPADATQLHQVVMNLALNAGHALGKRGGKIEVTLESFVHGPDSKAPPELAEGRYARLTVADNGTGMDEATLKRVFDPFFTTKPPGEGTGLGLSVVEGIIKGHNGAIEVKSELGKGTVFTLYFPATVVATVQESAVELIKGNGERVLYVDDDEALTFLAARALSRMGYRVSPFSSPLAALKEFQSRPNEFDLVVTDSAMPGLSGQELVTELRRIRPEIPIVMLSGYIRPEDSDIASRLRINKLLYKPNTIAELGQILSRLISETHGGSRESAV